MVYDELRRVAASQMARGGAGGHTLQPTALVHEAWMRLTTKNADYWNDRAHFFRTAAVAMRRILVDRAREKNSLKRGGSGMDPQVPGDSLDGFDPESRILLMDECLAQMEQDHPDCAKVIQLKFFAGLSNQETAALLGSSLRTVERQWAFARSKLYQMIRAREQGTAPEP